MIKFERKELLENIIPNTKLYGIYKDDALAWYEILPCEGYMLHNKARDYIEMNPETFEQRFCLGYGETPSSYPLNYEVTPIEVTDEYGRVFISYGEKEFFAIPKDTII